jgi:hypothetical protein
MAEGSDLAALGEVGDVLAGPKSQRGNCLGRLTSGRGDRAAAVTDEQISPVMGSVSSSRTSVPDFSLVWFAARW